MEAKRPSLVQRAQRPELQGHGVRTGAGRVLVLQGVVVVVLDGSPQRAQWEGPEPVEVDLLAEARGQRVHEQTGGGPLDVHVVRQPVPVDKDTGSQWSEWSGFCCTLCLLWRGPRGQPDSISRRGVSSSGAGGAAPNSKKSLKRNVKDGVTGGAAKLARREPPAYRKPISDLSSLFFFQSGDLFCE